ncbi:MAG: outer membrane beta-barrel protein [Nitrospirota bacterium]
MGRLLVVWSCALFVTLLAQPASAEWYIAGQVGGAFPSNLQGLTGDQSNVGATLTNVSLKMGPVFGGKLGVYSEEMKWLGMEIEAYQSLLKVKAQTYTRSQSGTTTTGTLSESSFNMTTIGLNLVVRYPGDSFQPYAGLGLGLFTPNTDSTTQAGLNALAGLRYKFSQHFALFGEGKYNRATIDFRDPTNSSQLFQGTYSAVLFVAGLSIHF